MVVEMKSADDQVAQRIIEHLRKEGLFSESFLTKLQPKLVAGTLSAEDWKLAVEIDRSDDKSTLKNENR
jgi:hypothetical protein